MKLDVSVQVTPEISQLTLQKRQVSIREDHRVTKVHSTKGRGGTRPSAPQTRLPYYMMAPYPPLPRDNSKGSMLFICPQACPHSQVLKAMPWQELTFSKVTSPDKKC